MFWIDTIQNSFEITSGQRWLRKKTVYRQAFMLYQKESVLFDDDKVVGRMYWQGNKWYGSFKTTDNCLFPLLPVNTMEECKQQVKEGYDQQYDFVSAFELFYNNGRYVN